MKTKTHRRLFLLATVTFAQLLLAGSASLLAQTTQYWGGGNVTISDGTPIPTTTTGLNGTWSSSISNWSSNAAGTTYGTFGSGNTAYFTPWTNTGVNVPVTIGSDLTLSGIINNTVPVTSGATQFTATSPRTLTLSPGTFRVDLVSANGSGNSALSFESNVGIAGGAASTFYKTGIGFLRFNNGQANNSFTGNVLIDGGTFAVGTAGANTGFSGAGNFTVRASTGTMTSTSLNPNDMVAAILSLTPTSAGGSVNQISDTANISIGSYATFTYNAQNTAATETIGRITLNGAGQILANTNPTNRSTLILGDATSGINRGADGLGVLQVVTNAASNAASTNITVTNFANKGELLPWVTTSFGQFMTVNATDSILKPVASVDLTSSDLSTWATTYNATSNLRLGGQATNVATTWVPTGSITSNTTIGSLGIVSTTAGTVGSPTLTIAAGRTLTIDSGGLNLAGSAAGFIANGTITTPKSTFYISTGSGFQGQTITSTLSGNFDLVISGISNSLTLTPTVANNYTGTTYVQQGQVTANAGAIAGNLVVNSGALVNVGSATFQAAGRDINLNGGILVNNASPTVSGNLTINNGFLRMASGTLTANRTGTGFAFNGGYVTTNSATASSINLLTNLSYSASSTSQAVFQQFSTGNLSISLNTGLNAGNAVRTFDIAKSSSLGATPEMVVDVAIANGGTGSTTGGLLKTGNGTLLLTGPNTYTGGTEITGGTLRLGNITAAAQSGLSATTSSTGSVGGTSTLLTFAQRGATDSLVVGQSVSGTNVAAGRTITRIINDYQVMLNGAAGTSAQGNGAANIASVNVGAFSRAGSLAGNVTVGGTGTFEVDSGITLNNPITMNTGGTFRNNGTYNAASLNVAAGSTLTGAGQVTGTVTIAGTLSPGNSPGTITLGSTILSGGGNYNWQVFNASGAAGIGYDTTNLTSGSALTLNNTALNKFNINLWSLSAIGPDVNGNATNFVNTLSYSWTLFATDQVITGFDANKFNVNVSAFNGAAGFANALAGGTFSVGLGDGNTDLVLNFTPIPEPSTYMFLAVASLLFLGLRRRRTA